MLRNITEYLFLAALILPHYCGIISYKEIKKQIKRINMENHTEIGVQYGKIHALYETIIYLQKEIKKETEKLEKLKEEEKRD